MKEEQASHSPPSRALPPYLGPVVAAGAVAILLQAVPQGQRPTWIPILIAAVALSSFTGGILYGLLSAVVVVVGWTTILVPGTVGTGDLVLAAGAAAVAGFGGALRERADASFGEKTARDKAEAAKRHMLELVESVDVLVWEAKVDPFEFKDVVGSFNHLDEDVRAVLAAEPMHWMKMVHPADSEQVQAARERAGLEGASFQIEYRIVLPDGSLRWIGEEGHPAPTQRGRAKWMYGRMVDITEQKLAQRRLAVVHGVSEVLSDSRNFKEAAPRILEAICKTLEWRLGAIWCIDIPAGVLTPFEAWHEPDPDLAEFARRTFEMTMPSGIGLPGAVWADATPRWVPDVVGSPNFPRSPYASNSGLHGALAFPIMSGHEVTGVVECFSSRIEQPELELLKMMTAVGHQMGQFMERTKAEEAVRESEARKTAVLESALDGIIIIDQEGSILEFNPAAETIFGFDAEEIVGKKLEDTIVPPALRAQHRQGIARFVSTKESRVTNQRLVMPAITSDNRDITVELTIVPFDVDGGTLFSGYLRDITEMKKKEEASAFISDVTTVLAESLRFDDFLTRVAERAVPYLADICVIDVVDEHQKLHRVVSALGEAGELPRGFDDYLSDPEVTHPSSRAFASGQSVLLRTTDEGSQRSELSALGLDCVFTVPLEARSRMLGTITLGYLTPERSCDDDVIELAESLAARVSPALDNALLYRKRSDIARTLEQSLRPSEIPLIPGIDTGMAFEPGGKGEGSYMGGDFYDVFDYGSDHWGIVMADVSGKGEKAAALTSLVRNTVRAEAMQEREPARIMHLVNEALLKQSDESQFCTAAYTRLNVTSEGAFLTLICAGHPHPLVIRKGGEVEKVGHPGTLLGLFPDISLRQYLLHLQEGDAIVYYTDGVIEARDPQGEIYGEERLIEVLKTLGGRSAKKVSAEIRAQVALFSEGPFGDDIAILVLKVDASIKDLGTPLD